MTEQRADNLDVVSSERETLGMLRASLSGFAEQIDPERVDREGQIPRELFGGLAELGAYGVSLPEAYGGAGLGLAGAALTASTLARRCRSVAVSVGLHLGLGTRGLVAFGSEAQKSRYLPELAAGARIAAFATTEANAGSDLAAIRTVARPAEGGGLEVEGEKVYVTNGGFAGLYTITASTPGLGGAARGHSLLLVERGEPGVNVGREEHKLGIRGSSTVTVRFEGVRVPEDRLLGTPGQGMKHLAHVLAWGRTVMAAGCAGLAASALDRAVAHASTRKQFGKTLASFDVVKAQLADLAMLRLLAEALVARTASVEEDRDALFLRSVAAKVLGSEAAGQAADLCVQIHGGAGFIEETGVPMLLRDARITRIFEGANDVLAVHAGLMAAQALPARRPLAPDVAPVLAGPAAAADALRAALEDYRRTVVADKGLGIVRQQRLLHRLGYGLCLSEAADAVVRASEVLAAPGGGAASELGRASVLIGATGAPPVALAEHALARLGARTKALLAEPELRAADAVCEGLYAR